jgi:HAD superfamily hydrolase (TIGR01509 family)
MDGTLVDTERALLEVWESVAAEMGYAFSRERMIATVGTTTKDTIRIMEECYPGAPHEEIRGEMSRRYQMLRANGEIGLRPGVREALDIVAGRGLRMAVCTATRRATVISTLESVGILGYFDVFVCGDEVTRGKPDPEPYLLTAARLGLGPDMCYVIEDSPSGARSALSAGMAVAVVPDMVPAPEDVVDRAAVYDNIIDAVSILL